MKKIINFTTLTLPLLLMALGFLFIFSGGKEFAVTKIAEGNSTKNAIELLEKVEANSLTRADFKPNFGESIGILEIDKIETSLPIVQGVDEDDLRKGVGHYTGTSYPLDNNQIVLSGHRDTVFKRMDEVEIGDVMTVRMPYGDFDYEVVEIKIVDADDKTIIVPHDEEILTVTTCYPFSFIGNAPDRYIINAKPIYDGSPHQ